MADEEQVTAWCGACGKEVAHWRINAALRICTVCQNEIHEAEVIMAKQFTDAERAGIQLRLADGAAVKELAHEMKRSYYTIYSIKKAMPTGAKGKKFIAGLKAAAGMRGALPPGTASFVSRAAEIGKSDVGTEMRRIQAAGADAGELPGATPAAENIPAIVMKKWIITIINRRMDMIRDELVSMVR